MLYHLFDKDNFRIMEESSSTSNILTRIKQIAALVNELPKGKRLLTLQSLMDEINNSPEQAIDLNQLTMKLKMDYDVQSQVLPIYPSNQLQIEEEEFVMQANRIPYQNLSQSQSPMPSFHNDDPIEPIEPIANILQLMNNFLEQTRINTVLITTNKYSQLLTPILTNRRTKNNKISPAKRKQISNKLSIEMEENPSIIENQLLEMAALVNTNPERLTVLAQEQAKQQVKTITGNQIQVYQQQKTSKHIIENIQFKVKGFEIFKSSEFPLNQTIDIVRQLRIIFKRQSKSYQGVRKIIQNACRKLSKLTQQLAFLSPKKLQEHQQRKKSSLHQAHYLHKNMQTLEYQLDRQVTNNQIKQSMISGHLEFRNHLKVVTIAISGFMSQDTCKYLEWKSMEELGRAWKAISLLKKQLMNL